MKKLALLFSISIIIMACGSSKNKEDEKHEVQLKITSTSDYCGGARPNDKLLEQLKTPKSYSNKDLLVSTENKLNDTMTTVSSNDKGIVTTSLTARTYYIYLPEKAYTNFSAGGSEANCKKWKNTPNGTFNVEKGMGKIEIRVHKTCSPCGAARM